MKNIKKTILLAGAALLAIASASVASAQIVVNVQFAGEYSSTYGPAYLGQGALATTGSYWNTIDVPEFGPSVSAGTLLSPLLAPDDATSTSVTVTLGNVDSINSFNYVAYNGGSLASGNNLMDSIAASPQAVSNFVIGGLTAGGKYNLYLYGNSGDAAGGTSFTIGSTTLSDSGNITTGNPNNAPPTLGWVQNVDYVEFVGVTADGSGDISGTWTFAPGTAINDGPFNGFQIQAETPAVPEPSVAILLGLGLMGLIALRRARGLLS